MADYPDTNVALEEEIDLLGALELEKSENMRYKLSDENKKKVLKGMAISGGGAALTFLSSFLLNLDVDPKTAMFVFLASNLINFLKEWLNSQR